MLPDLVAILRHVLAPAGAPPTVTDWHAVAELACEHRVQAVVISAVRDRRDVPPDARARLDAAAAVVTIQSLGAIAAIREIRDGFASVGLEYLAWKGPALSAQAWDDAARRSFDDVDIVVRPEDVDRARTILAGLGWRARHADMDAQQERAVFAGQRALSFVRDGTPSLLELHWAFGARRYAGFPSVADVLRRSVRREVGGVELAVPAAADTLLLHAVHATKHGWSALEDVVTYARLATRDDAALTDYRDAVARGLMPAIPFALGGVLARDHLGIDARCADFLSTLGSRRRRAVDELARQVRGRWETGQVSWRPPLAWDLAWTERRRDRGRLLAHSLFGTTLQEWQAVRLPAPLAPLYHLLRPARLVARALGGRRG